MPIFNAVRELDITWSFEYFDCVTKEDIPYWEVAIKQLLADSQIPITGSKTPDVYYVHTKLEELYTSQLSLRYNPTLDNHVAYERDTALMLERAATTLNISKNEEVYFFYARFTPVLRLPFETIALLKEQDIMMPEDLCIMPIDYNWLIFRSLENEWTWAKLKS